MPEPVPEVGADMAGKLRYWKESAGRFYARIAVPSRLRPFMDRPAAELIEPLGGDRRVALRLHPAAVARLQHKLSQLETLAGEAKGVAATTAPRRSTITTADFGRALWERYSAALEEDEAKRLARPSKAEIAAEFEKLNAVVQDGSVAADPLAVLDASLDYLVKREAHRVDRFAREARLVALRRELSAGETHQVSHEADAYLERRGRVSEPGTAERTILE